MAKKTMPTPPVSLSATLKKEMQRKFNLKRTFIPKVKQHRLVEKKRLDEQQDTIKEMYKAHPQLMKRATKTTLTRLLSGKSRFK